MVDQVGGDGKRPDGEANARSVVDDIGKLKTKRREGRRRSQELFCLHAYVDGNRRMRMADEAIVVAMRMRDHNADERRVGAIQQSWDRRQDSRLEVKLPESGIPRSSRMDLPCASTSMQLPPISAVPR